MAKKIKVEFTVKEITLLSNLLVFASKTDDCKDYGPEILDLWEKLTNAKHYSK